MSAVAVDRRAVASVGALGIILVAAGAAGALALGTERVPPDLRRAEPPLSAPTGRQSFGDDRNVQASFVVSPPQTLTVRAGGTVTAVACVPGRPVSSGSVLLRVDDKPVVALHTAVPLYRDLRPGDKGADVESLQEELVRSGAELTVSGTFRASTTAAVKALQKRAGAASPDGSVRLADYVWLPSVTLTPVSCDVRLGGTVSPGTPIASAGGGLSAVTLKSWPADLAPGQRSLTVFGVTGPLAADHRALDPAFLTRLAATPDFRALQAARSTDPTAATISLVRPLPTWKVTPSAVFAIEGAQACLASGARTYPVRIVGSDLGASLVVGTGQPPDRVDLGGAITARACR